MKTLKHYQYTPQSKWTGEDVKEYLEDGWNSFQKVVAICLLIILLVLVGIVFGKDIYTLAHFLF